MRLAHTKFDCDNEKERLGDLARIRNRLIHFGRLPEPDGEEGQVLEDATLFIRLTQYIVGSALGLRAQDTWASLPKLEAFLKRTAAPKKGTAKKLGSKEPHP